MSMSVFPVSETNDLQNTQKVPAVSKRGLKRRREKLPSEPGNTWWQHLGKKTQGDALQEFYVAGKKKGLNMTAKCFASRLYKHPSLVDVDMRRNAHRDAVEFVETMSKRANNAWINVPFSNEIGWTASKIFNSYHVNLWPVHTTTTCSWIASCSFASASAESKKETFPFPSFVSVFFPSIFQCPCT